MKTVQIYLFICLFTVMGSSLASDKPFAEHHVILQVSDNDPDKFNLTLDIANNLLRHYGGPDLVDIEVVTFAGGINLVTDVSQADYAQRISSLMAADVRFYVCRNTLDTIARKTGSRPEILEGVTGVQTGVAFMLEEIERGFTHIHP